MLALRQEFEKAVASTVPELSGNVQLGAVEAETKAPFATYSIKDESIRTKSGIAGYNRFVELSIYYSNSKELEKAKDALISKLDRKAVSTQKLYYAGSEFGFYEDAKVALNSYTLTFKIQ